MRHPSKKEVDVPGNLSRVCLVSLLKCSVKYGCKFLKAKKKRNPGVSKLNIPSVTSSSVRFPKGEEKDCMSHNSKSLMKKPSLIILLIYLLPLYFIFFSIPSFLILLATNSIVKPCGMSLVHLLSRSAVSDSVTPRTVNYQAPQSAVYSRQEYWSRLPFPPLGDLPDPGIKFASPVSSALQVDSTDCVWYF